MSNLLERALQTLWQALAAAGVVVPAFSDAAAWKEILAAVVAAVVAAVLSAAKTWLQERLAP